MQRWIAKRQTTAMAEDRATLVVIPRGAAVSVQTESQMHKGPIRLQIEATGENCWIGREQFFRDFQEE
jgi:hypothetical protein